MAVRKGSLFAVLILLTIGGLLFWWLSRGDAPVVSVVSVAAGSVQDTVANTRAGTIKACRRAGISPRLGGQIATMPVKEGDEVEAGQILMAFWNDDLMAQVTLAESEVKAAEARLEQACITAELGKREAARQRQLAQQNLASEEAIDKAESEALAREAACNAARSAVDVSAARLDVARAALDQTQLRAPFPGIIAEVNGEVGEFVTPSPVGVPTPPAVDLMDTSCLYVSAPIDEVDAPGIRVGMPAWISLDAFSGERFEGRVRRVAPYVLDFEKQARTVDVEVEFLRPADCGCMLPGYSADIEVILAEHGDVVRVPTEALREGNKVVVIDDDNRLVERDVEVGLSNWAWSEIRSGLQVGEQLVVSVDRELVEAGAEVKPVMQAEQND
jgi:HlyD family secretion protein